MPLGEGPEWYHPPSTEPREQLVTSAEYADGELIPGTVYRVERRLTAAGFGAVYDVADETVGRRYCLKTLHSVGGGSDIDEFRKRLAIEAQTLARLAHPNVVQIITAGVTADDLRLPYFVMERLHGRTLRETLDKRGKLDIATSLSIATQTLDALEHAHGRGVIHRDVKPENIFLHRVAGSNDVQVKLLDFGVVAFLMDLPGIEPAAGLSPRYAAPELLEGKPATPASDVYSMGLVLYEMLTGHGPFDGGDLADVARARLERDPAPLDVEVPLVLEDLIASALDRNPLLRPEDAFSFAETLRVLSGRISRVPGRGNILSSEPPPSSGALPPISEIPDALVEADWRAPPTPRTSEVARVLAAKNRERTSGRPSAPDARENPFDRRPVGTPSSAFDRPASGRETLVGIAIGLALLLVTIFLVVLKQRH